jgi:putative phosphoribosyl transferase
MFDANKLFRDREDAGRRLAGKLSHLRGARPIVLAMPRGGVPVARPVTEALGVPMEVLGVRRLSVPGHPELALGAVAEGGAMFLNPKTIRSEVTDEVLAELLFEERAELSRCVGAYRGGRPLPELEGRAVVLVDDGVDTGSSARAAILAVRRKRPAKLVLAVPVAASDVAKALAMLVDELVCLHLTPHLYSVGTWYREFPRLEDPQVLALLAHARASVPRVPAAESRPG